MKKRVLALLLAGVMALGMTACGGTAPEASGDGQGAPAQEGETGEAKKPADSGEGIQVGIVLPTKDQVWGNS